MSLLSISLFLELATYSSILPVICGLCCFNKISTQLKAVFYFTIGTLLFDSLLHYLAINKINNSSLIHCYVLFQTIFVGYFFYLFNERKSLKKLQIVIVCFGLLSLLVLYHKYASTVFFITRFAAVSSIFVLCNCLVFFLELMKFRIHEKLYSLSTFYIGSSLFVYHLTVMIIFLTYEKLDPNISDKLWHVKSFAFIILNIFISIAFLNNCKCKRK